MLCDLIRARLKEALEDGSPGLLHAVSAAAETLLRVQAVESNIEGG